MAQTRAKPRAFAEFKSISVRKLAQEEFMRQCGLSGQKQVDFLETLLHIWGRLSQKERVAAIMDARKEIMESGAKGQSR